LGAHANPQARAPLSVGGETALPTGHSGGIDNQGREHSTVTASALRIQLNA